jgi:cytochrome c oxidase subunit 2
VEEAQQVAGQSPRPVRQTVRTLRRVAVVPVLLLALTGCSRGQWERFGWPAGVTPQARRMLHLWQASTVAALIVGVLVWGLIFYAAIRFRRRTDEPPPQVRYNLPIEVLYTVVPFLIVAVLFYYTAIDENYVNKLSAKPDVTIGVQAFQWNWQFTYDDKQDNAGGVVQTVGSTEEIPVLVLPTNKRIRFVLNSDDVIHSFFVPEFLFKRDVLPGHQNEFEVTIDKKGAFVGRCAEYCGTYHPNMNFEVRAVSDSDYQQFLNDRAQGQTTTQALRAIGQPDHAVTTHPFDTVRTSRKAS